MSHDAHRAQLTKMLEHSKKLQYYAEAGIRFHEAGARNSDPYNTRFHQEAIDREQRRLTQVIQPEIAALEYALDLIDRWGEAQMIADEMAGGIWDVRVHETLGGEQRFDASVAAYLGGR